jgi:hypothetical protein
MTKEELKLEAIRYLENFKDCANCKNRWGDCADQLDEYCLINGCCFATPKEQDIYLAGAEPREKRIAELEAQIEKMKCCGNCKYYQFQNDARYYTCIKDGKRNGKYYRSCEFNLEKWEGR